MTKQKKYFLRVALPTPLRRLFDYLPPQAIDIKDLIPGVRVRVPFQSRTLIGILIAVVKESSVPEGKLKQALEILDQSPVLPADIYKLCEFAAAYYHYSLGEVLMSALPFSVRRGKATETKVLIPAPTTVSPQLPELNQAQQQAVDAISAAQAQFLVFLLDGVTGSGKTEVYLRAIAQILAKGQQVLVLVPEISLTPQTIERFSVRFNVHIATLHSSLSAKQRFEAWQGAKSGQIKIVIGTRSAIFTPFAHLGLIIIDEEHDTSFKQQDRFRYHARDLAIMRANLNQIPIVLGSATPSLESLLNAKRKRYVHLSLPERAGDASLPEYQILDLRKTQQEEGLSTPLLQAMQAHLDEGNQVLLFLNRRGFAPVLYCKECHFIVDCKRCDARMVYHRTPKRLQCHHCDSRSAIPLQCQQCGKPSLEPIGLGTQRLEQLLVKHFPSIPIIRIDRDNTKRKGAMQAMLTEINTNKKAILLGTQMLAKGHHFSQVTLVGIIDADSGLFSADFRAAEQMGQLFLQVSGRAGRAEKSGTVILQTHNPQHPLLQTLIHQGYPSFSQTLLAEREQALLPPFSYFAVFRAEAYVEKNAHHFLQTIKELCATFADAVTVLGPVPALIAKRKGMHCQHLVLKASQRNVLQHFLKKLLAQLDKLTGAKSVKWILDVDPVEV